jgi:hypothetical protein
VLVDSAVVGAVKELDYASLLSRGGIIEVSIGGAASCHERPCCRAKELGWLYKVEPLAGESIECWIR